MFLYSNTMFRNKIKSVYAFVVILLTVTIILFYYLSHEELERKRPEVKYHWEKGFGQLNGPDINPLDPLVLTKLRDKYLVRLKSASGIKWDESQQDTSMGQVQIIQKIFHYLVQKSKKYEQRKFFYVEVGALDGITRSNTLTLERRDDWNGLLIEADQLLNSNRTSWISNSCLAPRPFPLMVSFHQNSNQGKIDSKNTAYTQEENHVNIQCFPFESFIEALHVPNNTIDYFSLDVEGDELPILRTIPFQKLQIYTLSVEFIHGEKEEIKTFMELHNYVQLAEITHPNWLINDLIYIHSVFWHTEFTTSERETISNEIQDYCAKLRKEYYGEEQSWW